MLFDSVRAALPELRAEAESRMVDIYSIQLSGGMSYTDGVEGESWSELFVTRGRVAVQDGAYARQGQVGGRTSDEVSRVMHIPVDSPEIPAGRVSAVPVQLDATSDQALDGARLILEPSQPGSQTTARRIRVTEVVS